MKKLFIKITKNINLFRFNTLFAVHQKATAIKPYKWWSELRFTTPFHAFILVVYLLGMGSGFYLALPKGSEAAALLNESILVSGANQGSNIYGYNLTTSSELQVTSVTNNQTNASISGTKVVYQDYRNNNDSNIFMKDLVTGVETQITFAPTDEYSPYISGTKIVWVDNRLITDPDGIPSSGDENTQAEVYLYDIEASSESRVTIGSYYPNEPIVAEELVIWTDDNGALFYYDLSVDTDSNGIPNYLEETRTDPDPALVQIQSSNCGSPSVYGNNLVWSQYTGTGSDIFWADLSNPETLANPTNLTPDTDTKNQYEPSIYENKVVWTDWRNDDGSWSDPDIYMADLSVPATYTSPATPTNLTEGETVYQQQPAIYGNNVVFTDYRDGNWAIYRVDLTNPDTFTSPIRVTDPSETAQQDSPAIYGDYIVWPDERDNVSISLGNPKTDGTWTVYPEWNNNELLVINNTTKVTTKISSNFSEYEISDGRVILKEYDTETDWDQIFLYDIVLETKTRITSDTINRSDIAFDGNRVAWVEDQGIGQNVFYADISDPLTFVPVQVTFDVNNIYENNYKEGVNISDNVIAWSKRRTYNNNPTYIYSGISYATINTDGSFNEGYLKEASNVIFSVPDVSSSSNKVTWVDTSTGTYEVYALELGQSAYDISPLTNGVALEDSPKIDGNLVYWTDYTTGVANIYVADVSDLNNPNIQQLSPTSNYQYSPHVTNGAIVWRDYNDNTGNSDIYIGALDKTGPVFENLPGTSTKINITEGQIIRSTEPLQVMVKPVDQDNVINRVEFYLGDSHLFTENEPDNGGVYLGELPLSAAVNRQEGVAILTRAYDNLGNYTDLTVIVLPDPWYYGYQTMGAVPYPIDGSTYIDDPSVWDDRVVFSDNGLWLYDISDRRNYVINTLDNGYNDWQINGNRIVTKIYNEITYGDEIYVYDITDINSPQGYLVHDGLDYSTPSIWGDWITWNSSGNVYVADISNLNDIVTYPITTSGLASGRAEIWENKIVWLENAGNSGDVFLADISDIKNNNILAYQITNTQDNEYGPVIWGNKIAWVNGTYSPVEIFVAEITNPNSPTVYPLNIRAKYNNTSGAYQLSISESRVVWGSYYNHQEDVFAANITNLNNIQIYHYISEPETQDDWRNVTDNLFAYENHNIRGINYILSSGPLDIYPPEQITITPTTGDAGKSVNLTVSAWDNAEAVKAEISLDLGPFVELSKNAPIAKDGGKTTGFFKSLTLPFKTSANYVLKITDIGGNVTTVTGTFTINSAGTVVNETKTTVQQTAAEVAEETTPTEEITEDDQGQNEDNQGEDEPKPFFESFKDFFVTLFTNPREIGKKINTKVLGAFTDLTNGAIQVIKETPPAVANTFPYILFILLGIMASVFFLQAQSEARQSKKLIDILTMEKAIYEDKENFLTLSAHYLRTPATIITGGIDIISEKQQAIRAKLAPIAKSLTTEIQSILKSIEDNSYLAHIKKPELDKEKRFLLLSPFLLVPILLVAGTAIIANLLFIRVAEINISSVNLIAEILIFVIVVQVLVTFARHRYTEGRNRKEYEQTLSYERNMDKARNKFVDEVGTKITPYISDIDKYLPKDSDKATDSIREGKHRLSDILYKFSLLSESTKGGFRLVRPATVSLKTQAKVALGISEKDIKAKEIKIKEDLGSIELKTDPRKIEFIMSSLISNAIKFTNPKTTIDISATKQGKKTTITVTDEGPGISEEGKLHLFKPFTRTTSALNFDYEGFGLSLYLSKILINSLGGDISLDSKEGKGTTVRVEV